MKKDYNYQSTTSIQNARIAMVQASWHHEHTSKMVKACTELLTKAGCSEIVLHQVPGSYEIPLAAKKLAKLNRYDAIVVFGAIVKGDTDHYQVILETCIRELGRVMYDFEIPIIMEILPVHRLEDLVVRCEGPQNKGIEAGQAVIETVGWHRSLAMASLSSAN